MQESTIIETTSSGQRPDLESAAHRAERWSSEPFLHPGEDPEVALAPGTARRSALDDAQAEMDRGLGSPSSDWKVRYGLMLGLERVLAAETPTTATGTTLRRHQIDALAGMLTELIAATQRRTRRTSRSSTRRRRRRPSRQPTRAPSGAIASAIRPPPARPSPPPASSTPRESSAC